MAHLFYVYSYSCLYSIYLLWRKWRYSTSQFITYKRLHKLVAESWKINPLHPWKGSLWRLHFTDLEDKGREESVVWKTNMPIFASTYKGEKKSREKEADGKCERDRERLMALSPKGALFLATIVQVNQRTHKPVEVSFFPLVWNPKLFKMNQVRK